MTPVHGVGFQAVHGVGFQAVRRKCGTDRQGAEAVICGSVTAPTSNWKRLIRAAGETWHRQGDERRHTRVPFGTNVLPLTGSNQNFADPERDSSGEMSDREGRDVTAVALDRKLRAVRDRRECSRVRLRLPACSAPRPRSFRGLCSDG